MPPHRLPNICLPRRPSTTRLAPSVTSQTPRLAWLIYDREPTLACRMACLVRLDMSSPILSLEPATTWHRGRCMLSTGANGRLREMEAEKSLLGATWRTATTLLVLSPDRRPPRCRTCAGTAPENETTADPKGSFPQIQILDTQITPTPPDLHASGGPKFTMDFTKIAEATHSYPVTRLLWEPPSSQKQSTDLLATSGDHLRLWSLPSESPVSQSNSITSRSNREMPITKLTPLALLSNSKTPDHTAPLTSLDWNTVTPSLIITSSIDTTCTIWDIPSLTAKTQLIAHDKEVYDVRFCANSVDVFVSCGQDGSVRMFDLRSLEHSTIIYEPTGKDDRGMTIDRSLPEACANLINS